MGIQLTKTVSRALVGAAIVVGAVVAAAGFAAAASPEDLKGQFMETDVGADRDYTIRGPVYMTVSTRRTEVEAIISGLDVGETYGSHLHNGTCADGGGTHYQDVEGGATTPPNELWLSSTRDPQAGITPTGGSRVEAEGSARWAARTDSTTMTNALSVIIHDYRDGARIACADLN